MAASSSDRPLRACEVCEEIDDHPRHVIGLGAAVEGSQPSGDLIAKAANAGVTGDAMNQLVDPLSMTRHMDCCRDAGCPDGSCATVTAGAEDKRGNALVKHLTSRKA